MTRTYVVVVHGIGEQRKNETAVGLVNRVAEAGNLHSRASVAVTKRHDLVDHRDIVTVGAAMSQTGTDKDPRVPWLEYAGIGSDEDFLGFPGDGSDIRFVDMHWSEILKQGFDEAGQEPSDWARGLVGRLLNRNDVAIDAAKEKHRASASAAKGTDRLEVSDGVPFWIRRLLFFLAEFLILLRLAMNFRFKEMSDLVFSKFLGDAQVYGEYEFVRGRAVKHFHTEMQKIHSAEDGAEYRIVVVAHSLGSIMSFDALTYAAADHAHRCGSDRWPGYEESESGFPGVAWLEHVEAFVTLGSPIDKYLMLWPHNYRHLVDQQWFGDADHEQIRHFNFCDELDPVGHRLDVVAGTPVYKILLNMEQDWLFNRYSVPGAAHNAYWKDVELVRYINSRVIRGHAEEDAPPIEWFNEKAYVRGLYWLYTWIPLFVIVASTWAFNSYLDTDAESFSIAATAGSLAVLVMVFFIGRRLIDLALWWRQVQVYLTHELLAPDAENAEEGDYFPTRKGRGGKFIDRCHTVARLSVVAAGVSACYVTVHNGFTLAGLETILSVAAIIVLSAVFAVTRQGGLLLPKNYRPKLNPRISELEQEEVELTKMGKWFQWLNDQATVWVVAWTAILLSILAGIGVGCWLHDPASANPLGTYWILFAHFCGMASLIFVYRSLRIIVAKDNLKQAGDLHPTDFAAYVSSWT